MRRKFRRKRLRILLLSVVVSAIFFIWIRDIRNAKDRHAIIETPIERVQLSHVKALNNFVKAAPTHDFYAYNQKLSDNLGAYRLLPDTRSDATRNYYLTDFKHLKVSVIIAFHNEARSTLLRTVMSVYQRTPAKYLHEIILLDDYSNDELLLSTLRHLDVPPFQNKYYNFTNTEPLNLTVKDDNLTNILNGVFNVNVSVSISTVKNDSAFPVIKMQRNSRRFGLIESRNLGARLATGDYLLFLDSHCEVNVGWLEPLLERVAYALQTNTVGAAKLAVSPVLDSIDATTLQYHASSRQLMGGFDWNLHFHWIRRHDNDNDVDNNDDGKTLDKSSPRTTKPFKSPVFSGGIFMIARNWFLELNSFNPYLQIWGGESIEFSIKLWLCGGQIEIVPCSRVGHIFRKEHPFRFPNGGDGQATYLRNSKIIAEYWLDSYKHFFYALRPEARNIRVNIPEMELKAFKLKFQCKPFDWYLNHVFPQLRLPNEDLIAFGKLSAAERCLHIVANFDQKSPIISSSSSSSHMRLQMVNCYHADVTHWYLHRYSARMHSSNGVCLSVVSLNQTNTNILPTSFNFIVHFAVVLQYCHQMTQTQRWTRRGAQLIHERTHLCLDNPLNDVVAVSHCRHSAPTQLFRFTMEMEKL